MKGRFNILRIIITILILWSFAFVTGLTPSVLRATLMFSFLQAGNLMKRRVNGINSVLASAFVLILIKTISNIRCRISSFIFSSNLYYQFLPGLLP